MGEGWVGRGGSLQSLTLLGDDSDGTSLFQWHRNNSWHTKRGGGCTDVSTADSWDASYREGRGRQCEDTIGSERLKRKQQSRKNFQPEVHAC